MSTRAVRRVVVKVGTGIVARPDGGLALGRLGSLVEQLTALRNAGVEVVLVSSGAVGLGARRLGFRGRPDSVVDRQACAAAGQGALMAFYDGLFQRLDVRCAQVLLTESDFHFRARFNNLTSTLERLLKLGAVPVLNENDALSTAELAVAPGAERGGVFGDNDRLSALVASYMAADLLVLLTNVDGVYSRPPGEPGARRIALWDEATTFEEGAASTLGRGGMGSKIDAALLAARRGVRVVIESGDTPDVLRRIVDHEPIGTTFAAPTRPLSRRKAWLAFATAPSGMLIVNAGARDALVERGASLLEVGVVSASGELSEGAVVRVVHEGVEVARGMLARWPPGGASPSDPTGRRPLIHRDDLVLL